MIGMDCFEGDGKIHEIPRKEFTRPVLDCLETEFLRAGGASGGGLRARWSVVDFPSGKVESEICYDPGLKTKEEAVEITKELIVAHSKSFSRYWKDQLPRCLEG